MENKSHALAAGIFVLFVSAMVVAMSVWLMRDSGKYHSYELSSREGVSGLQPQAAVRYKGVAVGKVTHIGFDPQVSGNVLIRIAVNDDAPITPTTFAVLGYQGVTGLAYVLLNDAGERYTPLPLGASGLPRLPLRSSPFSQLADQGPAIIARVEEATRRINQLLGDDNQKLFSQALANIGQAVGSANTLSQRLDATVVQRLDPALAALQQAGTQVSGMAAGIGQATQRLNEPDGAIEQATRSAQTLARALERFNASTLPRVERAADDTGRAARLFGRVATGISDNPQAFIYGPGHALPGPGESGFATPAAQPEGLQP